MHKVFIGLGSNLGQSENILADALDHLSQISTVKVLACSAMYRSKPLIHPTNSSRKTQPDYINAVACVTTVVTALALLDILQSVEAHFGRIRDNERWASRTLDLDILLFDNIEMNDTRLIIPHSGMLQRDFVLYPLFEIAPDIEIPRFGSISKAIDACEIRGLEKLNEHHC